MESDYITTPPSIQMKGEHCMSINNEQFLQITCTYTIDGGKSKLTTSVMFELCLEGHCTKQILDTRTRNNKFDLQHKQVVKKRGCLFK